MDRPVLLPLALFAQASGQYAFTTDHLRLSLGADGVLPGLSDPAGGIDYLAQDRPSPLISIRSGGLLSGPTSLEYDPSAGRALVRFVGGAAVTVGITEKPTHIVLEVLGVRG